MFALNKTMNMCICITIIRVLSEEIIIFLILRLRFVGRYLKAFSNVEFDNFIHVYDITCEY